MEHAVREEGGALVVTLRGTVDLEHSPVAREVLLDSVERAKVVLVVLTEVTYMDSSGVASLVEAYQAARTRQGRFGLVAVGPRILRVLQLARLDRVFTIHATLAEGLVGGG
jgi:anti-sigma B factor antagonist